MEKAEVELDAIGLTTEIVAAYVKNKSLAASELPRLLVNVHAALGSIATGRSSAPETTEPDVERATPAQIRKSVTPDALISFVDGKPYKTLKRHLSTHGLDPQSYRQRYGLPADYPMVPPSYAAQRSALAKGFGLGRSGSRKA